ncbi:hypothetical protein AMJ85_01970 [candidate division BRC1 bacterium SM23_51]|nr:MAG: hypothetical protein AMJ85_01970 [candidate division BRC1 bacterium SM23_51]
MLAAATTALGFNPPKATEGPLTVEIAAPDVVHALREPFNVEVWLNSSCSATLDANLEVWVIDDWRIEPGGGRRMERPVRLAAGAKERVQMKLTAGPETHNAHYPIHARATFTDPDSGEEHRVHAIEIFVVDAPRPSARGEPVEIEAGATSLLQLRGQHVRLRLGEQGTTQSLGVGWHGSDRETGTHFAFSSADRGRPLSCLSVHPPWRKGWGTVWADYDLILPETKPITLTFSTAIRDHTEKEPPSDGVEFRVAAAAHGKPLQVLFTRLTKSKRWENASVDLSEFAGQRIALRLWTGPGPANNTACDQGYWGSPTILAGGKTTKDVETADVRVRRLMHTWQLARQARDGKSSNWTWQTTSAAGTFGAAVTTGPAGVADVIIAFSSADRALLFDGLEIRIDDLDIETIPSTEPARWKSSFSGGRGVIEANLLCCGQATRVRTEVWAEKGALRFRFSMPSVKRDKRGRPRFTLVGIGPCFSIKEGAAIHGAMFKDAIAWDYSEARRVYAGLGNVAEKPGRFDLRGDGFNLSTRHVGVDFENGISLVQACDIFPDRFHVDPERSLYSLQTHHDGTISLIPSEKGAFAAARVYREEIAGFKPSPGVARLKGKMCLDYWGTSYQHGIDTVEQLARYGVTDCVYVWHNWQRWGYDYRLPEIYPARGSHADFLRLAAACRRHGILFAPHDNYIDFYPDAEGYSYEHIIFNEDGTPQKAWYNRGREAQSYRWLPHAFRPWLERNVALLARDVRPTAYFIDVFTAIPPMDYYDRAGRFYPKTETIARWSECFDYVRAAFGGAPQISEAGHDTQIGHVAAGESDHMGVAREGSRQWAWNTPCGDAERTPWHDMASHGSFILFAGGLANRYVGGLDRRAHGYGSDDYMSLTVLGGRNPMAHGDASLETIRTYWLLHDICAELGRRSMETHAFGDDNIHRQTVRFGDDAVVYVNRGNDDWKVAGVALPEYGFLARAGAVRADVTRRAGLVSAFAESSGAIFADARPERNAQRQVIDFGPVATNGAFRLLRDGDAWRILVLPGCPSSEIRLRPQKIAGREGVRIEKIEKLTPDGTAAGAVSFKQVAGAIVFETAAGDFGYRITWH